jgi:hypothetical protein
MIDEKYIELMHREIDGDCSGGERSQLKAYLKDNPEANRLYEELTAVTRMFGDVEQLEPPAELRESIFSAVFGRVRETGKEERFASFKDVFRLTFNRKFAYAFTAGLIVGICLFALLFRDGPSRAPGDLDHLYGTLATRDRQVELSTAEPVEFTLPGVSGFLQAQYTSEMIIATLNLSSESSIRVVFECAEGISFDGLRAPGNRDFTLNVTGNRAELVHAGDRQYVAVFKGSLRAKPAVDMKIFADESLLFETSVLLGRR